MAAIVKNPQSIETGVMTGWPLAESFALLLGLAFFLGFAFEDFYARAGEARPGGIRTFPMLALGGGLLYELDPKVLLPFTVGLLTLGAWLLVYYREHMGERDEEGRPNVSIIVPVLNVHAYLLGAIALALPHWVAVGTTVVAVLLFTAQERLHALVRRVELRELITLAQFLILTGLVLPLLPDTPVTTLTAITPRQAWLALLAVCTISYVSYLLQRIFAGAESQLAMALLGGLYSSTATTVVLARRARAEPETAALAQVGIVIATGIMYLRILAVVAVFNIALAKVLGPPLVALSAVALAVALLAHRGLGQPPAAHPTVEPPRNPLELGTALIFTALFIVVSLLSAWVAAEYGRVGIYVLAAIVGVSDIDPFVLNLAQGGASSLPTVAVAAAILIAAASNNVLKAGYAIGFGGGRTLAAGSGALVLLAAAGIAIAIVTGR
jgi:uncharacterized membrane protein (DUF4010 family)